MQHRETMMHHIDLDTQGDAVKQFFLSLPVDPEGAIVETKGHIVARVFRPESNGENAKSDSGPWTDAKNHRRCDLIDKEIDAHLTPEEVLELEGLQRELQRHVRKVAPLPLEDARRLEQELLQKAEAAHKR